MQMRYMAGSACARVIAYWTTSCKQYTTIAGQTESNNTHGQGRKSGKGDLPFRLNSMLGSALVGRLCLRDCEFGPRFGVVVCSAVTSTSRSSGASKLGIGPLTSKKSLFKNRAKSSSAATGSSS